MYNGTYTTLTLTVTLTGGGGGVGRDEVWDRETMFSQLAKQSPTW